MAKVELIPIIKFQFKPIKGKNMLTTSMQSVKSKFVLRTPVVIYLLSFGAAYLSAIAIALLTEPALFSNVLGFFALLSYLCTVIPGIFKVIVPGWKRNTVVSWLLRYRRQWGVSSFLLALNHGVLQIIKQGSNLLDPLTYIHYFMGLAMMLILTLLAITSSDESVKHLKKNWKKLHQWTWLVMILLPWHIIDKMHGNRTYITPISVLLSTVFATLFLVRIYKEKFSTSA